MNKPKLIVILGLFATVVGLSISVIKLNSGTSAESKKIQPSEREKLFSTATEPPIPTTDTIINRLAGTGERSFPIESNEAKRMASDFFRNHLIELEEDEKAFEIVKTGSSSNFPWIIEFKNSGNQKRVWVVFDRYGRLAIKDQLTDLIE